MALTLLQFGDNEIGSPSQRETSDGSVVLTSAGKTSTIVVAETS